MKNPIQRHNLPPHQVERGFALVATLSLMILLTILAVGLLSLSAVSMRGSSQAAAQAEAQANARLALMIALGELQKEMGPDMRVSAESALFDANKETETVEGVEQSHWLASYDSWGDWLNATYAPPGDSPIKISDTYEPRRVKMFRRWLLSMPLNAETNIKAPDTLTWDNSNSVILVGEGSLGKNSRPDQITRAYLTPVGKTGKHAWWIGPENQKARIDMAKKPRTLNTDEWQTAQSDTAEVGVGALTGMEKLDDDASLGDKLITPQTLRAAQITEETVKQHFFDLTANSQGVLASVRTGQLRKDLSLLLEKDNAELPAGYQFNATDVREPSIRPMSPELVAKNPKIGGRHFQSWTNLRHYYRMYRQTSDATVKAYATSNVVNAGGGIGLPVASGSAAPINPSAVNTAAGNLNWAADGPYTDMVSTANLCDRDLYDRWTGSNSYWRVPIIAKITFIYSLQTTVRSVGPPARYDHKLIYTPVLTLWNPYTVRLRIPDQQLVYCTSAYPTIPTGREIYSNNTFVNEGSINPSFGQYGISHLRSGNGGPIIFEPGEFRVFSYSSAITNGTQPFNLFPGFDPMAFNGDYINMVNNQPSTYNAGITLRVWNSEWGGNINAGNTAGSLNIIQNWSVNDPRNQSPNLPIAYQNDWFNVSQQREYITPNPGRPGPVTNPGVIARWNYADRNPVPFAYIQLVLKGQSPTSYESIGWAADWRSRNWISGPPFYFGHGLYASEDAKTLHTQRLEHPYVLNFGPTSMLELPKLVFQQGGKAFLGSGSNPFEKVNQVPALELPTAPLSSLAGFSGMRINPGWTHARRNFSYFLRSCGDIPNKSLYGGEIKVVAYQSGVTGPGIGNSFMHPLLPRDDVYRFFNNSISMDPNTRADWANPTPVDTQAFCDHWDHVFLLNDALWDDYFVSSLADQTRTGASTAVNLDANIDRLVAGGKISNSRYRYEPGGRTPAQVKAELKAADGYLKAAKSLVVDGMFNVNSTSVAAWHALFAGIRERQAVYRDKNGELQKITVPADKRIALTRFDTESSGQDMDDPESGVTMPDGSPGWCGVRFLDDVQLQTLAEECVKQVKMRGPFLNFAEFINRRLSNDEMGIMGALQSAIDFDDANPKAGSINYNFKNGPDFMLKAGQLGNHDFKTPEAAVGSRFAGIPGYVIQSDLLKPIANTLSVRDDTFRIRAYGESLDANGKVIARAWCEAIVQRTVDYADTTNDASVPARLLDISGGTVNPINTKYGTFSDNPALSEMNRRFGRKFRIENFRWLNKDEV